MDSSCICKSGACFWKGRAQDARTPPTAAVGKAAAVPEGSLCRTASYQRLLACLLSLEKQVSVKSTAATNLGEVERGEVGRGERGKGRGAVRVIPTAVLAMQPACAASARSVGFPATGCLAPEGQPHGSSFLSIAASWRAVRGPAADSSWGMQAIVPGAVDET